MEKKIPLRMCVVCRTMKDKAQLLRVVKNKDNEVFVDKSFKANGRGAYVCNNAECLAKCIKQRSFNRAFKSNVQDNFYNNLQDLIVGRK